ncbi:uncharacterized protein METZ01_LOCUS480934, partial [marine metagenome]
MVWADFSLTRIPPAVDDNPSLWITGTRLDQLNHAHPGVCGERSRIEMSQVVHDTQLSIGSHFAKDLVGTFGSPLYVYDASLIRQRLRALREAVTYPLTDLHYACKANTNLSILRLLRDEGAYIDAVSPGEVFLALKAGFTADQILFTGNSVTDDEMQFLLDRDILINIDSLSQLERYGRLAPG